MAHIIPSVFLPATTSKSEEVIYHMLKKQLDENWVVFHSYSFESKNCLNKIIDAEIDFLILHIEYGILIIEVKGGQIKYDGGVWYQNGLQIKSPFDQARSNKYKIKSLIEKSLNGPLPLSIGHVVCFPDLFNAEAIRLPSHEDIIITGKMVNYISESVEGVMKNFAKDQVVIDKKLFRAVKTALIPAFEFGTSLADRFGQEDRNIFTLTDQQCEVLSYLDEQRRVIIKGCAGSGKTVMAVKKAKQLSEEGYSVLFLCINILLAEKLKIELAEYQNVLVSSYHDYCKSQLEKNGIFLSPEGDIQEFFNKIIPQKFFDLISDKPIKYHSIIIDEGQDFLDEYWITINELIDKDGHFYVFYDPDQNIFNSPDRIPIEGVEIVLNKNCRNTINIFNEIKNLASFNITSNIDSPIGETVHYYTFDNSTRFRNKLSQILHNLVTDGNIREEQIVIIGTHHLVNTSFKNDNIIGKFTVKENGPSGKNVIPYFTCMKYKGLESNVVILIDFQDTRWNKNYIKYTAISRAKHLLIIMQMKNNL